MLKLVIKSIGNNWTYLSLLIAIISLSISFFSPPLLDFSLSIFLYSTLLSLVIWNLIGTLLSFLPRIIQIISIVLVSIFIVFFFLVAINIYTEFSVFIDHNLIMLAVEDPEYLKNVSDVFFQDKNNVGVTLILIIGLAYFLSRDKQKLRKKTILNYVLISLSFLFVLIAQNQFRRDVVNQFTAIDMSYLFNTKSLLENKYS